MTEETLYIRNMVCDRCISLVAEDLRKVNIPFKNIRLGEVVLLRPLDQKHKDYLSWQLGKHGFNLLDHENTVVIEKVKNLIVEMMDHNSLVGNKNYIHLITERLHLNPKHLRTLFSSVECISLEKFIILQKVEQLKELLHSSKLTLSQVSDKLGYRNVQHLSNQFKEETGMTPGQYKRVKKIHLRSMNGVY